MGFLDTSTVHFISSKPPAGLLGVLVVLFAVFGCSGDPSKNYTITVDYVFIEPEEDETVGSKDYSSATVTLSRVDVSESQEKVVSELSASSLRSKSLVFRGQIERPMWVEVVADSEETPIPLIAKSFVEPGENISLALIDYGNPDREDTLAHIGTLSNAQDQDKKFVLSGDIGSSSKDSSIDVARLYVRAWEALVQLDSFEPQSVVLQNGSFSMEMECTDPVVVELSIVRSDGPHLWAELIAEPGESVFVQPRSHVAHASPTLSTGWFQTTQEDQQRRYGFELVAVSGSGRHAKILESWKQSFTYRHVREQMNETLEEHWAKRLEDRSVSEGVEILLNSQGSSWVNIDPIEGCEHIDLSLVLPRDSQRQRRGIGSKYEELRDEMYSIRRNVLDDFARSAVDPMNSLLALELGALGSTHEHEERLQAYDRLAKLVSPEVVEERINPPRRTLVAFVESTRNEGHMVPGQKAPDFELPDLNGIAVNFYEVVNKSNLVYVVFVRRSYSRYFDQPLGELQEMYESAGLQIIQILVGSDSDTMEDTSEEESTNWITLRDSSDFLTSKLARTYATVFYPKNYLIDSKGCIVQSDFSPEVLNELLSAYFDNTSSDE